MRARLGISKDRRCRSLAGVVKFSNLCVTTPKAYWAYWRSVKKAEWLLRSALQVANETRPRADTTRNISRSSPNGREERRVLRHLLLHVRPNLTDYHERLQRLVAILFWNGRSTIDRHTHSLWTLSLTSIQGRNK